MQGRSSSSIHERALSSRVDDIPITVEGEEFDIKSLPPIRNPRLRSVQVPQRLPSITDHGKAVISQPQGKSARRVRKVDPSSFSSSQSKGKEKLPSLQPSTVALSPLLLSSREKTLSPFSSSPNEKRVIRVIRAAPRGFFNIPQIPNYNILTETEREILRTKFDLKLQQLQKANPSLPSFGKEEPLHIVHAKYDQYVRQAYIEKTIIKYKIYLTIFFLVIEALGTRVLGVPISGYTKDQISQFIFYEQLLLELAERSKSGGGEEWPVEIRILLYMVYQVVVFVIIRFVSGFLSPDVVRDLRGQINEIMVGSKSPPVGEDGVMEPPKSSGFDPTNLMASLGSLFAGGGSKPKPKAGNIAEHKLPYDE